MKNIIPIKIFFVFLSFIYLSGCQSPTENSDENSLLGEWQLRIRSGGLAGISDTLDTSKDNYIIFFQRDNTQSSFYNDSLLWKSAYTIKKEKTFFSTDSLQVIYYDDNTLPQVITYQNKDTLVLADDATDAFIKLYIKITK